MPAAGPTMDRGPDVVVTNVGAKDQSDARQPELSETLSLGSLYLVVHTGCED